VTLERSRTYDFTPSLADGASVGPGDVVGAVLERGTFVHKVMVPPGRRGTLRALRRGTVRLDEPIAELDGGPLYLWQRWPVRRPRPFASRLDTSRPLLTGQRVFDLLFPVAEGGTE